MFHQMFFIDSYTLNSFFAGFVHLTVQLTQFIHPQNATFVIKWKK